MNYEVFEDLDQQSEEWFKERISSATWSKMQAIMWTKTAQTTLIYDMLEWEFAPLEEKYKSPMMQRWNDKEQWALDRYEVEYWVKLYQPWYIKLNDYTGLSPDAVLKNSDGIIYKWIEVKSLGWKKHIKHIIEWTWPEKEYRWQVVQYFLVCDTIEEVDFILWNPDMVIKDKQFYVVTLKREDFIMDIAKAKQRIEEFRELHLSYVRKLF